MRARFHAVIPLGLLAIAAAVVAGCGGSGGGSATAATGGSAATSGGGGGTVMVANNPQLGRILVDSQGMTVYTFQKDSGTMSNCSGACAHFWPAVTTKGAPKAGSGVNGSMLGTTKRSDGTTQVTFAGHPLYTYAGDQSAGQVTGNGLNDFGGVWNAVQPSGAKAPAGSSSGGGSTSSGATSAPSSGGSSLGY